MAEKKPPVLDTERVATATLKQTPETQAASAQNLVVAIERELDALPYDDAPGSKYQKKLAELRKAQAAAAEAASESKLAANKAKAAAAKKKVKELETQRKRLEDKGVPATDPRIVDIDNQLSVARGETAVATSGVPSAIKPQAGVLPPAGKRTRTPSGATATTDAGVPNALGPTGGTPVTATPPTGGKVVDKVVDKTAWISWMRQTFKTLDDTNERAIINDLLATAKKDNWDEQQFLSALEQKSAWWRNELPSLQQFFLISNDPRKKGQFQEQVNNKIDYIETTLEKLGVNLNKVDPITGKVMTPDQYTEAVKGVALEAIKNGWDDADTQNYLATKVDIVFSGGGSIGTAIGNVKRWADAYGISINENYAKTINASLLDPNDGRDIQWWYNEMQRQAAELYAPFAGGLAQGRTLRDMTASYRETVAKYLEVDENEISWNDLMDFAINTDDKGNQTKSTMSDVVKKVKQNPMWQYTRNAKETYTNLGMDLLRDFGVVG